MSLKNVSGDYSIHTKPVLKWAGGKSQLLKEIFLRMPNSFEHYIEPFVGGGALFFALAPDHSIISDSNPELINLYQELARNVDGVIKQLQAFKNTKDYFYETRALAWDKLPKDLAAARTVYLNKTCYNGLYRVNRKGQFNVPYANNPNANFCNEENLLLASEALKKATIICADYNDVLLKYASPGDFVFIDPPYIPVSQFADFKRYTKDPFGLDDQVRLATTVRELVKKDCYVMLTNSNHPKVWELYDGYKIEVFSTRRAISKKADSRIGEDVIVTTYE